MSSQKRKQESKSRNIMWRKNHHPHHIPSDPDTTILQEVTVGVMTPGLHHEVVLRTRAEEVVPPGVVVLPIIMIKVVLHIRIEVTLDTGTVDQVGTETVDPVATETVMDTGIVHHKVEVLVITIDQCVQVEVMGHHLLGVWNLHQLITMTDTHLLQHHITMIEAHRPLLMDMHLLHEEGEEEVVNIMVVGMIVTEVVLPLYLRHIITPRGGTELLETFLLTL